MIRFIIERKTLFFAGLSETVLLSCGKTGTKGSDVTIKNQVAAIDLSTVLLFLLEIACFAAW